MRQPIVRNPSYGGADIHEEAIAHPAMVAPGERRAPRGRVMAVAAPGRHPAMVAVGMLLAAVGVVAGMHLAVEAVDIPAVVGAVIPAVEDTPATVKGVVAS